MAKLVQRVLAAVLVACAVLMIAPAAGASDQTEEHQGPPIYIDPDCLDMLIEFDTLNDAIDEANDDAQEAWDDWMNGDITDEEFGEEITRLNNGAVMVNLAYRQEAVAWLESDCGGFPPPKNKFNYPWM